MMLSDPRPDDVSVPCKYCGRLTRMTGTKLCDVCYNMSSSIFATPEGKEIVRRMFLDIFGEEIDDTSCSFVDEIDETAIEGKVCEDECETCIQCFGSILDTDDRFQLFCCDYCEKEYDKGLTGEDDDDI